MRLLGYTRATASTPDASVHHEALTSAGVEPSSLFTDLPDRTPHASAPPGLRRALQHAEVGDTLVVWRVDCLGRSLVEVVRTLAMLKERGVNLRSLQDHIDPDTPSGRLMFNLLTSLADYERELAAERRNNRATVTTRKVGRPPVDANAVRAKLREVHEARASGSTAAEAARLVGWSRPTYYRHLKQHGSQP